MKVAILGGAGIQALGTIYDLLENTDVTKILIADADLAKAEARVRAIGDERLAVASVDLANEEATAKVIEDYDVVINCGPAFLCPTVTRAALRVGKNYVDLGAWPEQTEEQLKLHPEFEKAGITAILGMGSAPGISNMMALVGVEQLDTVQDIDIIIAMRDFTQYASPLVWPYALDTILDEYTKEPIIVRDGIVTRIPPLVNEPVIFEEPIGLAYPMYTIHPEPITLYESFRDKGCRNTSFRIALPEEFHRKIKFLVELGFGRDEPIQLGNLMVSPRQVLLALAAQLKPDTNTEREQYSVTRVVVRGEKNGQRIELTVEMYVGSMKRWNIPAGALKTSVPPSIVAQMLAHGQVKKKGVFPPEKCLDTRTFFAQLAKRGMEVYWKTTRHYPC
jgi:saccharopine dehydrogenase-like NADP-dependent oxidoreductase